jgi:hypothetical protein
MLTAEECRKRAEECKSLASQAEDELERETLARITQEWNALAEHKSSNARPIT